MEKISLGSMTLERDDIELVDKLLENKIDLTKNIEKDYENKFSSLVDSKFSYSFIGGRIALASIINALGIKKGDEVILPAYSCVVVYNAFKYIGAKINFCDIELDTFGLDIGYLKKMITDKTKLVVMHHLFGLVSRDYDQIGEICGKKKIPLIEDCAHATGAKYKGRPVGNKGIAAYYSSEQSKVFNTFIGGFSTTNDPDIAEKIKNYQSRLKYPSMNSIEKILMNIKWNFLTQKHTRKNLNKILFFEKYKKYIFPSTTEAEVNHNKPENHEQKLPPEVAIIGINQLKKIEKYNKIRVENSKKWDRWCDLNNYKKPFILTESEPVFLRYPVLVSSELKKDHKWAEKLGVNIGVWFVSYLHPSKLEVENCPNAKKAVEEMINFPTIFN